MKKTLSKRETQVLKMLLAEYSVSEIANTLNLHINTVCGTRQRIFEKWEVESMIGLTKEAIKRGILELDEDTFEQPNPKAGQSMYFVSSRTWE